MPKVNSRFYSCSNCNLSTRFKKNTYVVFLCGSEKATDPGAMYREETEYECVRCGYVIQKIIEDK